MNELDPFEVRAERVLAVTFRGIHHCEKIEKSDGRWTTFTTNMSTFDFDELTRLVVAAHDNCIRASVMAHGPRAVKIILHNRKGREGSMCERHPTIEDAIKVLRA